MKIIFEDDSLLVFDKPPGLVVDKSETQTTGTLQNWLEENYPEIKAERMGIVHRLDKDTSGVILIAKTEAVLQNLQGQFKDRKTKKEYVALVHGKVTESGVVEGAIGRNPGNREKFIVLEEGKEAMTEYEPISNLFFKLPLAGQSFFNDLNKIQLRKLERMNYDQFSLVRCFPKTGRTHQIRVHLKYLGHPIVADEKYVGRRMYRLDKRWCPRMFLHAEKIGFYHPSSGEWMDLESKLPEDLESVMELLVPKT